MERAVALAKSSIATASHFEVSSRLMRVGKKSEVTERPVPYRLHIPATIDSLQRERDHKGRRSDYLPRNAKTNAQL